MKCLLIKHIAQIATPVGTSLKKGKEMKELRIIEDGAIYVEDGIIRLVGKTEEIMAQIEEEKCQVIDGSGKCAVPGFVDSHTHFIFGGYRPQEFIRRLEGASYMEIMQMGGGILASVNATREADLETFVKTGKQRLNVMLSQGVTTVEGKSGYGLDLDCEIRQLEAMKQLNQEHVIDIIPTYLGAHAVPPEYKENPDEYLNFMIEKVLPIVKEKDLAKFCDVFCEEGVFSIEESRKLLKEAKKQGFSLKLHADEIVTLGGGELAAELDAVSADHLLMVSDEGVQALANSTTCATLLPATAFSLNKPFAPARKLIDGGCGVALASDFNPGSCFCDSIPLLFALACIHMKMTVEEALTALTLNGAAALKLASQTGSIEVGKKADINLLAFPSYQFLVYHTANNIVDTVIKKGEIAYASTNDSCQ